MGVMNDPLTNDLFPRPALPVTLREPVDLGGFRRVARRLLARQILPAQVNWHTEGESAPKPSADDAGVKAADARQGNAPSVQVPPEFMALCESVILHSSPDRFDLLYRLLWRLVHERGLHHPQLDADRRQAQQMAHAVERDMHKMKASLRFRSVQDDTFRADPKGGPLRVAWYETEHHIVEAVAPFFARRFAQMRWAILTPERSVEWNGAQLRLGPGVSRQDAPPPDADEQTWLACYQRIFKQAHVKLETRRVPQVHEMPEGPKGPDVPTATTTMATTATTKKPAAEPPVRQRMLSFNELREATNRCRECPIGEHATQAVPGEGPAKAKLMFVGEQPGDQEDLRGHPFVGPAGQLLDRALRELGIPRDQVFVSNAVKHFKYELRGKRRIHKTPTQREAAACLHWLEDEIVLVQPEVLVALGATAARSLMGEAVPVMATRGRFLQRGDGRKVLVTLHPSALLRAPGDEREAAFAAWLHDLSPLKNHLA